MVDQFSWAQANHDLWQLQGFSWEPLPFLDIFGVYGYDKVGNATNTVLLNGYASAGLVRCETPLLLKDGSQNLFQSPLKDVAGEPVRG